MKIDFSHPEIYPVAVLFIVLILFFIGIVIGENVENSRWEKLMLEMGYAEMVPNEQVKVFKWK